MIELFIFGIFLFTISVFGISWLVTQSLAFEVFRSPLMKLNIKTASIPFVGKFFSAVNYLFNCIVCVSVWVSLLIMYFKDTSMFMSAALPPLHSWVDVILWAGYGAGSTWIIGTYTGDAS